VGWAAQVGRAGVATEVATWAVSAERDRGRWATSCFKPIMLILVHFSFFLHIYLRNILHI
jgi:hypothetical protein